MKKNPEQSSATTSSSSLTSSRSRLSPPLTLGMHIDPESGAQFLDVERQKRIYSRRYTNLANLKSILSAGGHESSCGHSHGHEEVMDWQIQMGQWAEYLAVLASAYVTSEIIDSIVNFIPSQSRTPNDSFFNWNSDTNLGISNMALALSAPFVIWMMYGAAHCHAKLETLPRIKEDIIKKIDTFLQRIEKNEELTEGYSNSTLLDYTLPGSSSTFNIENLVKIQANTVPFSPYKFFLNQFTLMGDFGAHMAEFIGLWLVIIDSLIKDQPVASLILTIALVGFACLATLPEYRTCKGTLEEIEALEQGYLIVNELTNNSTADKWTIFSAIARAPALGLNNYLAFQQIFVTENPAPALLVALFISYATINCQFAINANTQMAGQDASQKQPSSNTFAPPCIPPKKLNKWESMLVECRTVATGGERAEPLLYALFRFVPLSNGAVAGISIAALAVGTFTALSDRRNAKTHLEEYKAANDTADVGSQYAKHCWKVGCALWNNAKWPSLSRQKTHDQYVKQSEHFDSKVLHHVASPMFVQPTSV